MSLEADPISLYSSACWSNPEPNLDSCSTVGFCFIFEHPLEHGAAESKQKRNSFGTPYAVTSRKLWPHSPATSPYFSRTFQNGRGWLTSVFFGLILQLNDRNKRFGGSTCTYSESKSFMHIDWRTKGVHLFLKLAAQLENTQHVWEHTHTAPGSGRGARCPWQVIVLAKWDGI